MKLLATPYQHPDHRPYDGQNKITDESTHGYNPERPEPIHYRRMRLMAVFQSTWIGAPMIWYGTEVGMYGSDDPHTRKPMWWDDLGERDNPDYWIDTDLREHFRALFRLRHANETLRLGEATTAVADDHADVYGYYRHSPDAADSILVLLNNSESPRQVVLDPPSAEIAPRGFKSLATLHGEATVRVEQRGTRLVADLPPLSGVVIKVGR